MSEPDPDRFSVARATLWGDAAMTRLIKTAGVGIIAAVCGIFAFILWQVAPLFKGADVAHVRDVKLDLPPTAVLGFDEWESLPFFYVPSEDFLTFVDLDNAAARKRVELPLPEGTQVRCAAYSRERADLLLGLSDGTCLRLRVVYDATVKAGKRIVEGRVESETPFELGVKNAPLEAISLGIGENRRLVAGVQRIDGKTRLCVRPFVETRNLLGEGMLRPERIIEAENIIPSGETVAEIRALSDGESLLVLTEKGEIFYLVYDGARLECRQRFFPFGEREDKRVALSGMIFGDVSLVCVGTDGQNRVFSLLRPEGANKRVWQQTKTFPPLRGTSAPKIFDHSVVNKAFLIGNSEHLSLRYHTTQSVRWDGDFKEGVRAAFIGEKYTALNVVDARGNLKIYALKDSHPDSGWNAFFGKIWYEGAPKPDYVWQSASANDDAEAKLSLVPLIFGTLKGTFFALVFALPVSLLAAIYASQFLHPRLKASVKPLMEIMASLPSVVLGFLGALWLAPLLETRVPSVIAALTLTPLAAAIFGWAWTHLPVRCRRRIPAGKEFLVALPVVLLAAWVGWETGPWLEQLCFVARDSGTGLPVADFRLWWPNVVGAAYEQRNSLIVGFMMGFAVVPIIFTIAEDAISNVPKSLTSASLALGASRWQTCRRIVLPAAAAGIFSAVMIGFGRAVGETMIVVMATGNTPVMDWNIFSGMRTLSANIAMELPEASQGSTHYRALFLGAVVLFLFTFILNTAAEILRRRLRKQYKAL